MDIKAAKLTKQGKTVEEDPQPGKYYRVEVPDGQDVKAAALQFKKQFPKSFFVFRSARPASAPTKPDGEQKGAKDAK